MAISDYDVLKQNLIKSFAPTPQYRVDEIWDPDIFSMREQRTLLNPGAWNNVPQEVRNYFDAINSGGGSELTYGPDGRAYAMDPLTGRLQPMSSIFGAAHENDPGQDEWVLPEYLASKVPGTQARYFRDLQGDDLGIGEFVPLGVAAMMGAHFAGVPGFGAEAALTGEAVSGAYGATASELANAAASYGAGSASAGATGGGMEWWEAFNGWEGTDIPVLENLVPGGGSMMPPAVVDPIVQEAITKGALTQTAPGVWELTNPHLLPPDPSIWERVTSWARNLLPGGGDGINLNFGPGGGGVFGGGLFDTALATAPILAAINYAKNQGPFDTSRLTSTYDQFQPSALAFEYDQNTSRGREALTSSLTNRGVMGSSFGNMDMTNFNTTRDLGRQSLLNQGFAARGDIAAKILDAQIKERALKNDLYGRSLLALGNVFGGRK